MTQASVMTQTTVRGPFKSPLYEMTQTTPSYIARSRNNPVSSTWPGGTKI